MLNYYTDNEYIMEILQPANPYNCIKDMNNINILSVNSGCHIISTGCGSGKTTSIKQFMATNYDSGILYCVDTKSELLKMYSWIVNNLCNNPSSSITMDDVLMLCGTDEQDSEEVITIKQLMLNQYRNAPEIIFSKKILLITHIRFWTDLPNYFLIYRPNAPNLIDAFDGDFSMLMSRSDLRQYVFFDETPTFIRPFCTIPKYVLGNFLQINYSTSSIQCKSIPDMEDAYNCFIRGSNADFFRSTHALSKLKIKSVLLIVQRLYLQWINSKDNTYYITFTPADLAQNLVNTHVIIFEGAGDVLIGDSSPYKLCDIQPKYNSQVDFCMFHWSLKRKSEGNTQLQFSESIESLKQIVLSSSGATLIVVWCNLNEDSDNTDFVEWIKTEFATDRLLVNSQYSITYYGASDTKSTNDYRNYSNIVLCGRWSIPEKDTHRIRTAFASTTSNFDHRVWYFIQLISRIGIRNHSGGNYKVFFSDDYEQIFIDCLDKYFNHNVYSPPQPLPLIIPDWELKINDTNIRKDLRQNLKTLCLKYPTLQQWVLSENSMHTFDISIDELYLTIPRNKKERARYGNLKKALLKLGINLNIV